MAELGVVAPRAGVPGRPGCRGGRGAAGRGADDEPGLSVVTRGWWQLLPGNLIHRLPGAGGAMPRAVPTAAVRAGTVPTGAVRVSSGSGLAVTRVGVVIPAHDEEALLPACLAALGAAAARAGVPVSVVVVLDTCADGSLAAVRAADPAPFGRLEHRVPGTQCRCRARGGLPDLIGARDPAGLWLATTDADSTVPPDWIVRQLAHARLGARAVIGTVQVADWSQHPPHAEPRSRARYRARDGHRHVHGADMSMAASADLAAAGGFPAVAAEEDVAMIGRLAALGEPSCGQRISP